MPHSLGSSRTAPPVWPHLEPSLKTIADPPERDRWVCLRFSIIGPLMAAPPAPGQLNDASRALAAKVWGHPVSGLDVRIGASTIERGCYRARRAADPVAALKDGLGGDEGGYGDQIHRYDEGRAAHNIVDSEPVPDLDDPPF